MGSRVWSADVSRLKRLIIDSRIEQPARTLWSAYRRVRPAHWQGMERNAGYDAKTEEIASQVLTGAGVCVDAGAHTGEMLARFVAVSPGSRFVAIEPIPGLAKTLRRRFPHVTVHQVALAEADGTAEFRHVLDSAQESSLFLRPEREAGRGVRTFPVETRRLDNLLDLDGPRIEFVKLDVEGAEAAALRGATRLLRDHRPVVVLECGPSLLTGVRSAFDAAGYTMSTLEGWLRGSRDEDVAALGDEFYFAASPA